MSPLSSMCCVAVPLILVGLLGQTYVPQILAYRTDEKLANDLVNGFEQEDAGKPPKKKFVQTSGGCKAWCMKQAVPFPLPSGEQLQELANEKCGTRRGMKECKDCEGGGLTIPDCREKYMTKDEVSFDKLDHGDKVSVENLVEEVGKVEQDDSVCKVGGDYTSQPCSFQDGEICSHLTGVHWCPPPSRNPGHKFRTADHKPLCCDTDKSHGGGVEGRIQAGEAKQEESVKAALKKEAKQENAAEPEPTPPLPVCGVNEEHRCRNVETGGFAKKVCCDPATLKMLEDKDKAEDVCATVEAKYCKPKSSVFDGKRKKYPDMPESFSCKRMYFCIAAGEEKFGPVPSQVWCSSEKTKRPNNFQARKACVAVAKYVED